MEKWWARVKIFEFSVIILLMAFLMIVVAVSTLELGWLLLQDLGSVRGMPLEPEEMFEVFGFFLLVLIGVELLHTLQTYSREGKVHAEVVLEVALIAVAQKVIILDLSKNDPLKLVGLSAMILALAVAFRWVHSALRRDYGPPPNVSPLIGAVENLQAEVRPTGTR
jgi:uncharacterized membrane protein (DUF373 family)